jgi:hypothetical protein
MKKEDFRVYMFFALIIYFFNFNKVNDTVDDIWGWATKRNYKVEVNNSSIDVYMRAPTIGFAGINEVSFDGFKVEDVEKKLFKKIRLQEKYKVYDIFVHVEYSDQYGNYHYGKPVKVSRLSVSEVKKYKDYYHFRGRSNISAAY